MIKSNNPINELNTEYLAPATSKLNLNKQQMYTNNPISTFDNETLNSYRSTIEQLRTKTESMNMALESALVPSIFYGSSIIKKDRFVFEDKVYDINRNLPEYVFKCNMIKYKSDKLRRLCYSRTLNEYTLPGDTIDIILERLNEKYKNAIGNITYEVFIKANPKLRRFEYDMELDEGIIIDTTVQSTMYNLIQYGYIFPFLGFMNNRALSWDHVNIFNDGKDSYVVIDGQIMNNDWEIKPDEFDDAKFLYLDIPFNIKYYRVGETPDSRFWNSIPMIWFELNSGYVRSDEDFLKEISNNNSAFSYGYWFPKIYIDDKSVKYEEFLMDEGELKSDYGFISKFGILYNKKFNTFDYRCKLKRFNFLCFEDASCTNHIGKICDDFQVESHQFNIVKITLDKINNKPRRFKIFYNTKVLYDQDNIFRFKNINYLSNKFFEYIKDVNSNVQLFIDEIYNLISRDTDDIYKLRTETIRFNNLEEGSTPYDEFIYYENYECRDILREFAYRIFNEDQSIILETINNLIDRAYIDNYNAVNPITNKSPKNEWFIRKNLAEMFLYTIDELSYPLSGMSELDEVFDFTYKDTLTYEENLTNAAEYIIGYDMDKLEASINRDIISITKTGSEMLNYRNDRGIVTMSRWSGNNYVMIFQNGKLYSNYNTITYTDLTFKFYLPDDLFSLNDEYEFVFFLNINNNVIETTYKNLEIPDIKSKRTNSRKYIWCIPCNTNLFKPEDLLILTNKLLDNDYNNKINFNDDTSRYKLSHKILSYDSYFDTNKSICMVLKDDIKTNGSHRVSKQNNEEYFIQVAAPDSDDYNKAEYKNAKISVCSSRQFKYIRILIRNNFHSGVFDLSSNTELKYCIDPNRFMIFVNGTILPRTYVYVRSVNDTPVWKPILYINIDLKQDDVVEIFYLPNELQYMNSSLVNATGDTRGDGISVADPSGYIKFYSYKNFGKNSKHSLLLFINGKKIPASSLEDVTTNMIKVFKNLKNGERLEIYNFVNTTDLDKIYIKDGLTYDPDYISISNYTSYDSLLDKIVNGSTYSNLNLLFRNYASISNTEETLYPDYLSKREVLQKIIETYQTDTDINSWIVKL